MSEQSANDIIKSLKAVFENIGDASAQVNKAFQSFVGVPPRLTWPVVWCKDHDQLEGAPGCLLAQARRER